jgi:predicted RND superfamily exporter protein
MDRMWTRYATQVVRRPWVVLALSLVVTAGIAAGIARLRVTVDPEQELPPGDPYVQVDRAIRADFGGRNFVALAIVPRDGDVWRVDVLRAVHALTLMLLDAPGVIRQNVISLSSPYVRVPVDRDGVLTADYLMHDPPADDAAVATVRAAYEREALVRGTVVSDDGRAALVLADFWDGTNLVDIARTVDEAAARFRSPGLEIAITGAPIFASFEQTLIQQQRMYFAATLAAIVLVLYLAFGHVQGVVLPTLTAWLATLCALGFLGFVGIPLNAWTAAVPVIVVTVAAGHSAQMLKRYYEEHRRLGDPDAALVESTRRIAPVMVAAGGTAASGFAALALLGIPTLTGFGLGVAAGIVAAVGLELTFMVAIRALWRVRAGGDREPILSRALGRFLAVLGRVARRPVRVVVATVALAAVAVVGLPRVVTETNVLRYWSARTRVGHDLRVFDAHFPSTTPVAVLLEGPPGSMQSPEAVEVMTGLQRAMVADPEVGRTSSIVDVVRRTFEVFSPEDAAAGLPSDREGLAQLFFLASSPAFERFVNRDLSHAVVTAYLNHDSSAVTRRVLAGLRRHLAEHPPRTIRVSLAGGRGPLVMSLNDAAVRGKVWNIATVFVVIFVIAGLLLRSAVGGAYVVAPLAVALLVDVAIFAWAGIAFDLVGASIAAIGVAIGADYAIYFLYRVREELAATHDLDAALDATLATAGRAILFVALAIGAGFGVYATSEFYSLQVCGILVPLTMASAALTTVTLLPALLRLQRPRFVLGAAAAESPADAPLDGIAGQYPAG